MKKQNWENMMELRANYGAGTKMVRLVLKKSGRVAVKRFVVK